jgi:hypothetical protein
VGYLRWNIVAEIFLEVETQAARLPRRNNEALPAAATISGAESQQGQPPAKPNNLRGKRRETRFVNCAAHQQTRLTIKQKPAAVLLLPFAPYFGSKYASILQR